MLDKKTFRREMLALRDAISPSQIQEKSLLIVSKLKSTPIYQEAKNILYFVSFGSEVNTHPLIKEALTGEKNVFVPFIDPLSKTMRISLLKEFSELSEGYKGILEPKKECIRYSSSQALDLILTPCVSYDIHRYRVGYGKGFYDRFFESYPSPYRIGLCFEESLVDEVPRDSHDKKVNMVITDKKILL